MSLVMPKSAFPRENAPLAERLIAHRGVPRRELELSARSIVAAREAGAPMIEIDLRRTREGRLVLHHDETLARLFDDPRRLSDLTLDEARACAERVGGEGALITLDEALALTVGRCPLDIELKPDTSLDAERVATSVVEALIRAGSPRDVIVTSESRELLRAVRAAAPTLPTGLVFRSGDERDPVECARDVAASVVVANASRVDADLAARAREAGLALWSYVARDLAHARELVALGCAALFVDDFPTLSAHAEQTEGSGAPVLSTREEALLLAIDLGSSSTKAALVSPRDGILARRSAATPYRDSEKGDIELDANEVLALVSALIEELADECVTPPRALGIASQRSTGLWASASSNAALSPALSWRDPRGEDVVASLAERRAELEERVGLPLAPAWTAVRGRVLETARQLQDARVLVPLGAWIAAQLTGEALSVDPGLANRTFLMKRDEAGWDPVLLEAFGYRASMLPPIFPSVHERGALRWRKEQRVPLLCLAGDQQCAYVGAAGPTDSRLVVNLGTGSFVMRLELAGTPLPAGARRAPLWTSTRRPTPRLHLVELPVLGATPSRVSGATSDDALRAIARARAEDEASLHDQVRALSVAVDAIALPRDQSIVLTGGGAASPHLFELVRSGLQLPVYRARESETTLLGAARLAAAGAKIAWSLPPAGGLDQQSVLPV